MSLLPELSPMAAILLALRLEPFQYWKRIQAHASATYKNLPPHAKSHHRTAYYKRIASLAGVLPDRQAQRLPGSVGFVFWVLFNNGFDRCASIVMTILALALVVLGAGQATGAISWCVDCFEHERILWTYWPLSALTGFSVVLVLAGDWYTSRTRKEIDSNASELEKHVSAVVPAAQLDSTSTP